MLKRTLLSLLCLCLVPAVALAASATATIDGNCAAKNATIVVPAGKKATGFKVSSLTPGSKCKVGGTPDTKGWGLTKGGTKVYYWSQFKSNEPSEVGGPLGSLTLPPGTYQVFVDGGSGAKVVLQYTLQ